MPHHGGRRVQGVGEVHGTAPAAAPEAPAPGCPAAVPRRADAASDLRCDGEGMSQDVPDSYDPKQPDLPTKAVDPDPLPDGEKTPTRTRRSGPDADDTDQMDR